MAKKVSKKKLGSNARFLVAVGALILACGMTYLFREALFWKLYRGDGFSVLVPASWNVIYPKESEKFTVGISPRVNLFEGEGFDQPPVDGSLIVGKEIQKPGSSCVEKYIEFTKGVSGVQKATRVKTETSDNYILLGFDKDRDVYSNLEAQKGNLCVRIGGGVSYKGIVRSWYYYFVQKRILESFRFL